MGHTCRIANALITFRTGGSVDILLILLPVERIVPHVVGHDGLLLNRSRRGRADRLCGRCWHWCGRRRCRPRWIGRRNRVTMIGRLAGKASGPKEGRDIFGDIVVSIVLDRLVGQLMSHLFDSVPQRPPAGLECRPARRRDRVDRAFQRLDRVLERVAGATGLRRNLVLHRPDGRARRLAELMESLGERPERLLDPRIEGLSNSCHPRIRRRD
jgi:hypothetical protein